MGNSFEKRIIELAKKYVVVMIVCVAVCAVGMAKVEGSKASTSYKAKLTVAVTPADGYQKSTLEDIQKNMLEKARAHRDSHIYSADTYDEFKETIANKPGFIKAHWCENRECEDKIKEDTSATARCIPFEDGNSEGKCICCGKPAKKLVYWGKAY